MSFSAIITALFLVAGCYSQPVSLNDLAGRIQVSEHSTTDELAAAAVAWSIANIPSDLLCNLLEKAPLSHSVVHAATLAKCNNINADTLQKPELIKDLYHVVMTNPETSQLKQLLSIAENVLQNEKYIIVHAGSYLLTKDHNLKHSSESKQIVAMYNTLAEVSSKDLLRFGDGLMSPLQKVNHLGSATYYLSTLSLIKPEPQFLQRLAEVIVSESFVRSAEDIASAVELANHISKISSYIPVICDTVNNKDGTLSLNITDILGRPVQVQSVQLVSCLSSHDSSLNLIEQSVSEGLHIFRFDLLSARAGIYSPIVKISSQGQNILYESPKMTLSAYGAVELSKFKAWTSSKHDDSISSIMAEFPNESKDMLEISSPSTHLHISFHVKSNLDDVAYIGVALINVDSNKHVVLTPSKQASGNYKLKLKYSHSIFSRRVPGNGRYQIKLLVSDPAISSFISWTICEAKINLSKLPGAVRLVSDFVHAKQPEITHLFRTSESRCHPILSFIFTAFAATPLMMLIPTWKSIGLHVSSPGMWGFLFHTYLSAIFVVLTVYWVKMTLFDLGTWLLILAPFTLIVGNRALRSRRESIKSKEDK